MPTSTKDTSPGTLQFGQDLLYSKHTEPQKKKMKMVLIQTSFTVLTCPELLHVTANKELGGLSWALDHFAYS